VYHVVFWLNTKVSEDAASMLRFEVRKVGYRFRWRMTPGICHWRGDEAK
jgi:hypothetical protein